MSEEEYIDDLDYITGIVKQNKKLIEENVQLHQENKELKENYQFELEENAKLSELWCKNNNILNELEEWLEMMEEKETVGTYSMVQDKIQELKKKFVIRLLMLKKLL